MVFVFETTKQILLELIPGSWRHLSTPRATCAFYFEPLHEATAPAEGLIHSQEDFPRQELGQDRAGDSHRHPPLIPIPPKSQTWAETHWSCPLKKGSF